MEPPKEAPMIRDLMQELMGSLERAKKIRQGLLSMNLSEAFVAEGEVPE